MSKEIVDFKQVATNLTDTEKAKLVKINLPAGDSIPQHSAGDRIIYCLNDQKIKYNSSKFGVIEKEFQTGQSYSMDADNHSVKNIGNDTARFIIFILK
jgi:quercetin dioxygenase-like cupin family protein